MTPMQKREVVKFAPNVPVEVALKFAMPGKVISTRSGERVLYKDGKYKKLEGDSTVKFLRGCAASVEVTDIDAVPLDYQNVTVTMPASMLNDVFNALEGDFREKVLGQIVCNLSADKRGIKAAIESGVEIPGATLVTGKTALMRR